MPQANHISMQGAGDAVGRAVMTRLDELARFSAERDALTRLYLSTEHKAAALQTQAWMQEAGMDAHIDAVGNVVGRYEGHQAGLPALMLGSHIDTVRNAGKYDGCFGVVAAIQAVSLLHGAGERLPFAVEVVAFGDEEGVRFPVTLTGSRTIAGTLDPGALDAEDADRISVRQALQLFGCNPLEIHRIPRQKERVLAFCEVHIEQGPVLEAEKLPVGVVTAISGASRFTIVVDGVAGHAGTVPMQLRQDALCAAAEMVLAIERIARETEDLVATVGRLEALPGAVNVIPSGAQFTLDIRSPSDQVRATSVARLREAFERIAANRRVRVDLRKGYDAPAATCDAALIEQLEASVSRAGIRPLRLPSGAGHDGLAMVALCPIAMLFVRCKDGISHNPAESITTEDADIAVRVLTDFVRTYDPSRLQAH
jgi:allantoate deiminase